MLDESDSKIRDIILDSISEGVFTVDLDYRITSFNRAAEEITGIARDKALGQHCKDILRADICEGRCALRETVETGKPIINKHISIVDSSGNRRAVSICTALLKDASGQVVGGVETFLDMTTVEELRKEIEASYCCEDILSQNRQMSELFKILPTIAESISTVLIEGESGTGKELFARAIHNLSGRKDKPFVAVNCGAIPETLLESELFGYKAGAFTDAKKDKPGRFALAEGGTILLDEIGDIPPAVQVRLLRVLQEKVYEPLGAVQPVKADVRVVAATHRDLNQLMAEGKFRQDLFYRINVIRLKLPPLRERKEDIPLLAEHFIDRFNHLHNKKITGVTDEVLAILLSYDYPGNVRELENTIEHCFVLCPGDVIEKRYLPESFRASVSSDYSKDSGPTNLKQMEKILIADALRRNGGNYTAAAKELGIHRSTLFRKIKVMGIKNS